MRWTIAIVLLAALAACMPQRPQLSFNFQVEQESPREDGLAPITVQPQAASFFIDALMVPECQAELLRADVSRSGHHLRLRVEAQPRPDECQEAEHPYRYQGVVHNLRRGEYRLVVEHVRDALREDGVVLETDITIR